MEISDEQIGKRVDSFLFNYVKENGLNNVSRNFLQNNWCDFILINNSVVKPSYKFRVGDSYFVDMEKVKRLVDENCISSDLVGQSCDLDIVYEDGNFLVINKPKGIVVHPGCGNKDNTLANYVKGYLEKKGEFDNGVKRAGIVHRLDKSVSGLIAFAKNLDAQIYLQKQFEEHKVDKVYLASVDDMKTYSPKDDCNIQDVLDSLENNNFVCDDTWYKIDGYIKRSQSNRMKMQLCDVSASGSKYSLTYIKPINRKQLLIKIETGRMHQIRASLEHIGLHIIGDTLYCNSKGKGIPDNIELESVLISFIDMDGKRLTVNLLNNVWKKA